MSETQSFDPADADHDGDVDFKDAAIRAELAVGHADDTPKKAWYHALIRLGRMTVGAVLCLAGLAMMVLPGPGVVVIATGLVVLSRDVKWADRALRYLRRKAPGLEEEGPIPKSTIIVSLMLMAAAGLLALWWFDGGNDTVSGWF
ncbi:MAG: hypothetical protein ACI81L_003473 [Verrucomicrobiales bacterium]|jgi:uncharacterized protein (TIGR02611 family)